MKRILLTTLAVAVAAAPALAHPGGTPGSPPKGPPAKDAGDHRPVDAPHKAKGPKGTHHLLHACVVAPATADAVDLAVLGGNHHMTRVLDGATTFRAALDAQTFVRLVGRARMAPDANPTAKPPSVGSYADLAAGDRVIVRFRADRGLAPDEMPAAFRVIDRGPSAQCPPVTAPEDPGDGGSSF